MPSGRVSRHPECKTEAFDIIRGLVDDVRLVPEKGNISVELKGELASILSLYDTKQKHATSSEERAEQIKMVAGACNNQAPTKFELRKVI